MNTSQFMDKQIMDLSNSQHSNSNSDFVNLMNIPQEDDHAAAAAAGKKEEIVPSYDFQPIRPIVASNLDSNGGTRVWNSADSKTRNYSSLDSIEPANAILEKDHNANNAALVSEIDRTMKRHADNIMHALEGVSARISQLESRTRHLENSMDDLKESAGNNHGSTDGQLRQVEIVLGEVQADVQVIRDKQGMVEALLHLAKLQVSKNEPQSEAQNTAQPDNLRQAPPAPQQSHQHLPPAFIQPPSTLSLPNAPPTASQQNLPPSVQLPNQFPPNQLVSLPQREPYFPPPPGQTQEVANQQYQLPPPQQLQPPHPAPPQQPYQPPPQPQYSQTQPPPPPPQQHPSLSAVNPPPPQPSLGHHVEEAPYGPPQSYRQPPYPPSGNPPSQQFYGAPPHMYEPPSGRPVSGLSAAFGPSSGGSNEPYSYSGSPSHYSSGSMKQQFSSAMGQGGGSGYPQLPTARILPQALPTASGGGGGGSGSAGSGNRAPIDDVVDKLSTMGFTRDQVRATVRRLTENGQSVDLNVVLDKLMNEGEGQHQKGWFGR